MRRRAMKHIATDERGSSAVEFAMILPPFLILVLAVFNLSYLAYAASSLHWTVEQAARCAAISQRNTSLSCGTMTSTKTYAASIYKGPSIGLSTSSFTLTNDTTNKCRKVAASGTYNIGAGFVSVNAPLSATACFPADTSQAWPS